MQPFGPPRFAALAANFATRLPRGSSNSPKPDFIRAWCAGAYAFPGLHPDGYEDAGSGWPRVLKRFAAEAWRRADAGELAIRAWEAGADARVIPKRDWNH